jgi:hypothetical protein
MANQGLSKSAGGTTSSSPQRAPSSLAHVAGTRRRRSPSRRENVTDDAMERAVAAAATVLVGLELRPDDPWEDTCRQMAQTALMAAAPVLAGELIACSARLLERAEWAESEVVRLRDERDHIGRFVDGRTGDGHT